MFVDFTADWCITCKVNETLVLSQDVVREELERWNYAVFKADWTTRNDAITLELAEWGRAGVPMYIVYPADPDKEPELLPELLTLDATLEVLREAGRDSGASDGTRRKGLALRLARETESTTFDEIPAATGRMLRGRQTEEDPR